MKKVLITGSGGLIGFEAVKFFIKKGFKVVGIDNNMREYFFGPAGSVKSNLDVLKSLSGFKNLATDIRDRQAVFKIYKTEGPFELVIHTAAQPSHDWAEQNPLIDFDINAVGSLNMLEGFRLYSPKGVFVHFSTVKVYGDAPNRSKFRETDWRYSYTKPFIQGITEEGISEEMTIDDSIHCLFGASKTAGDIMAQEYSKSYGLNVGIFRPGCLTGPQHAAVEMHGFIVYLIECALTGKPYTIFGHKGKQVRDQLHSKDVVSAIYEFYKNPKKGEIYNLGGGKENAISILEIVDILKKEYDLKLNYSYREESRIGDQKVCILDNSKFKRDYPDWKIKIELSGIIEEIIKRRSNE